MLKNYITVEENSLYFVYDVKKQGLKVNGRTVEKLCMTVEVGEDYDYDESDVIIGDLAVCWEEEDDKSYMGDGTLLMRNINDNNNNTQTMNEFYWEHAFDNELKVLLLEAGFSEAAVNEVGTSEWGMQEVGRASYDAYSCAEEIIAAVK